MYDLDGLGGQSGRLWPVYYEAVHVSNRDTRRLSLRLVGLNCLVEAVAFAAYSQF